MILTSVERIAEMRSRGWWGDRTLDDLLAGHCAATPDAVALVDPPNLADLSGVEPRRLTWRQVEEAVADRAALLHAHGLRRDDVVLVQLPNGVELSLTYLASARLGIVVSPAPAQYRHHELTGIARRVDAAAAVTASRIGKYAAAEAMVAVQAGQPSLRTVFVDGPAGDETAGTVALRPALDALDEATRAAGARAAAAAAVSADDVVTVCWTSGTEAEPKGIHRSHNEWIIMGESVVAAGRLEPGLTLLNPFPMVNMAGLATGLVAWLLIGGTLVQHHPFDIGVFLRQVVTEQIDYTVAPPAVLNALLGNEEALAAIDFTRLRRIGSGSAPLSDWMIRTFHDRYGVEIINYFGANEGTSFAGGLADVPDPALRAVCFPRLGDHGFTWSYALADRFFTRLVDPDTGREVTDAEQPAELRVKGPAIFSGYWRAPELTARAFDEDGWFRTGDLFAITGEGGRYYRYVGRLKDIVVRGGMNISAEEIEQELMGHPDVADVAVIGWPDRELGERLCACVVPRGDDVSMQALNDYLVHTRGMAVFKQIERLEVLASLPRNAVGKIMKRELRSNLHTT